MASILCATTVTSLPPGVHDCTVVGFLAASLSVRPQLPLLWPTLGYNSALLLAVLWCCASHNMHEPLNSCLADAD